MSKPCNCAQQNKERASYENMCRLALKIAKSEERIYVIIKKRDDTYTFEPIDAIGTSGEIVEYIHYL